MDVYTGWPDQSRPATTPSLVAISRMGDAYLRAGEVPRFRGTTSGVMISGSVIRIDGRVK